MRPYFLEIFGNPSQDLHLYNWEAEAALDAARKDMAALLGAHPKEIVFTSGATESNHLAILGVAKALRKSGKTKILSIKIEHSSLLAPLEKLAGDGFHVDWISLHQDGRVDLASLKEKLTPDVGLVSIAFANHEVGTIQDVASISAMVRANGALFHTDAAQAFGKVKINVQELGIDLMTLSGHKIYGPKGVGVLFVRRKSPKVELEPLLRGGSQEGKLRAGTSNLPLIVGMTRAAQFAYENLEAENARLRELRNELWERLSKNLTGVIRNGSVANALPHNLNVSFCGVDGAAFFSSLKNVAVSNASACLNGVQDYSQVLSELGVSKSLAKASVRIGIGRFTTLADIQSAAEEIIQVVTQLRKLEADFRALTDEQGKRECL